MNCKECNGQGVVEDCPECDGDNDGCSTCDGCGYIDCNACDGSGEID